MVDEQELARQELMRRGFKPQSNFSPDETAIQELQRRGIKPSKGKDEGKIVGGALEQFIKDPIGDIQAATDIVNEGQRRFLTGIRSPFLSADKKAKEAQLSRQMETQFNEKYGNNRAAKAGVFLSENAPLFTATAPLNVARSPKIIMDLAKNSGLIGKGSAYLGGLAAKNVPLSMGWSGISYDPTHEKTFPEKAKEGIIPGLMGTGIAGGLRGVELAKPLAAKGFNKIFGRVSPETIAKNVEITRGTNTPLGEVMESPTLKRLQENVLPKIPFSGVHNTQKLISKQLDEEGNAILNTLKGKNTPEDIPQTLQKSLQETSKEIRTLKNNLYNETNKVADEIGLKVEANNYSNVANKFFKELKENPFSDISRPEIETLLTKAAKQKVGSLKEANIYKGSLGDEIHDAYTKGDMAKVRIYSQLQDALDQDIQGAIRNSRSDALKQSYNKATEFYKNNIVPFEDRDIVKFTRQGGDTDTLLSTFIKGGANDRGNLASKLMDKLSPNEKKLVGYAYLSKAIDENGKLNPAKLGSLYNKLGEKTKKAIFPFTDVQKNLNRYAQLVNKNQEALNAMVNPKTGQRVSDFLTAGGIGVAGNIFGGLPGALGGIAGAGLTANMLNRILTSPKLREAYLRALQSKGRQIPQQLKNALTVAPNANY